MVKFISVVKDVSVEVKIDHDHLTIGEQLEAFESFLKASGYYFNGNVCIVPPEDQFINIDEVSKTIKGI